MVEHIIDAARVYADSGHTIPKFVQFSGHNEQVFCLWRFFGF